MTARPLPGPRPDQPTPRPATPEEVEPAGTEHDLTEPPSDGDGEAGQQDTSAPARSPRRLLAVAAQVVSVLLVAAGVTVFAVARHDRQAPAAAPSSSATARADDPRARLDDPAAAQAFVSAAVTEIVAVTQTDYRSLDDTLQAGLSVTTGGFRTRLREALTGSSGAHLRAVHRVTSVNVLASGIGSVTDQGHQANVLVFAQQSQSGTDVAKNGGTTLTTLMVTLRRTGSQYLISDVQYDANAGIPLGTTGLRNAAEAARAAVLDSLSYSRVSFTSDLVRAKTAATGALLTELGDDAAATLARMQKGSYDLTASVGSIAARQVSDDAATFLVAATGYRVTDTGGTSVDVDARYSVTVQRVGSTWLASAIAPVG